MQIKLFVRFYFWLAGLLGILLASGLLDFYKEKKPELITVAFDPVSTGPDTHFKVLQLIGEAIRMSPKDFQPEIWGYRNVWFKFNISDDQLIGFPVSNEILKRMNKKCCSKYNEKCRV